MSPSDVIHCTDWDWQKGWYVSVCISVPVLNNKKSDVCFCAQCIAQLMFSSFSYQAFIKKSVSFSSSWRVCHSHLIHICGHRIICVSIYIKHTHTPILVCPYIFFFNVFWSSLTHFEFHENHKLNYNRRVPNRLSLSVCFFLQCSLSSLFAI